MNFPRFRIFILLLMIGLAAIAQPKKPLFYHLHADYGMTSDKTTVVYEDHLGYIWIGTEEGLNKFISYNDNSFRIYKSDRTDSTSIENDHITALYEDSKNRLWVGSLTGLCLYNREADNFERVCHRHPELMNKSIHTIAEYNGNLWIGSSDQLTVYDAEADLVLKTYELSDENNHPVCINDLLPTRDHIWVASSIGLYVVENMRLDQVNGFEKKHITSLAISPNETLLAGTRGRGVYELLKTGQINELNTQSRPRITSNKINDLLTTKNGIVWIATPSGLTFLNLSDRTTQTLQYDFNNFSGLTDHEVRALYEDQVGGVWITTPLGGVNFYHAADNQFDYYGQQTSTGKADELLDYNVLSLQRDIKDNDKLWVGTRSGLSLFTESEKKFKHYPFQLEGERLNNQILSISQDPAGALWLGTERGLYTWNHRTKQYTLVKDHPDLASRINVVYHDREGNTWVGTREKGLKRLSSKMEDEMDVKFAVAEDRVILPNINDIIQQPDGTIWVGTANGLYYLENNRLISRPIKTDTTDSYNSWINFLSQSVSGQLVVGTRQEGLIMLNENGLDNILLNKDKGLPSNDVRSLVRFGDSLAWVSTNAGLTKLKTQNNQVLGSMNFDIHDGLQGKQFTPRAGAALNHNLYFGGLSGITSFDPTQIQDYRLTMQVNLEKLYINDQEIRPGGKIGVLKKSISLTDTVILEPHQNNITLEYAAMDFLRPDSVKYKYRLLNYDKDWMSTNKAAATYTNLPRGKQFQFEIMATSRFRDWSDPRKLTIYVQPYFYETAWFQILIAFMIIGSLFGLMRYREILAEMKQQRLEKMVELKTKELNQEVHEKAQTSIQLEKAKNDAEKANRIKSEFLANISHEIRTPLNGILGMSHLVSENEPNPENKEMLSILSRSAESLREIIDDLLDLSKIEAGKFDIVNEELHLSDLVKDVAKAFRPEVDMKSLELKVEVDPQIPTVLKGDELRIKQVLVNLLSNAIKFTESGTIQVRVQRLGSSNGQASLLLSVKDTGIGIPKDKTEEIFSSFTQIDTGLKRKYGGTGLGLAICKKLVNLMGGNIWAESLDSGSVFHVELTLDQVAEEIEQAGGSDINIPQGRKILLVEDNMVNTMVAVKMLEKSNQKVDTAIHGKEALKKLEMHKYDLILMDVQMPVMDGLEATSKIRGSKLKSARTPIVALTAGAMTNDRERCLSAGMNDFIPKPIMYDQLAKILSRYLKNPEEVPSMPK